MASSMCLAFKNIHDGKVLHRDIKSENIFLTSQNIVKFGEFGVSKSLNSTLDKADSYTGTPSYLSHQIVKEMPYDSNSDLWSLGVLLNQLCALKLPSDAPDIFKLYEKIFRGQYEPIPHNYSSKLKNIIDSMLNSNPDS
jgi:NIMA (never in mitosis gene a)-related kinase